MGTTLNISRRGALIRWESATVKLPPLGAALVLEFELPVNRFGRRLMRCRGRVVRICAAEKQFPQLALAINQMDFRDTSPGAVELPEPDGFEQVLM